MPLYNFGSSDGVNFGHPFALADSSGAYTGYATFQEAIDSAAALKQTVQMVTDVEETGDVTVTMADGVNVNLNGFTYNLSYTGSQETITIPDEITVKISNGILKREGGLPSSTSNAVIDGYNSPLSFLTLEGVNCFNTESVSYYGNCTVFGGTFISHSTTTYGFLQHSGAMSGINVYSYNGNRNGGSISNSSFYSRDGIGILVWSGEIRNCSGTSDGDNGIQTNSGSVFSSIGNSTAGYGISMKITGDKIINSYGYSDSDYGLYQTKGYSKGNTGYSTASYGGHVSNAVSYNGTFVSESTAALRLVADGRAYKCTVLCKYDDLSGHAITHINDTTEGFVIADCFLETTNAGAFAIDSQDSDAYGKWGANKYIGMTVGVDSVNANQLTNTEDSQGNILI
jgi:hypothetical protein